MCAITKKARYDLEVDLTLDGEKWTKEKGILEATIEWTDTKIVRLCASHDIAASASGRKKRLQYCDSIASGQMDSKTGQMIAA